MKKILITSALPYVNNVPHLGNIVGSVLSADVYARFCKSRGYNTRFICGTDEHGTTTEVKAMEEGLTPKEICDKYFKIHSDIYEWFGCSFDAFGRTSSDVHKKITQEIFQKLESNGFVSESFLEELYCESCKKSLADRFVEGTCPHCGFENARGDQCDKCSHLLNAIELINPKCKLCSSTPTKKNTKHLFIDLERLQPEIEDWISKSKSDGHWSDNAVQYTQNWLNEGLKKRAISRKLKWGIPIPLKGFEDLVFYVWFDAPIGYISITAARFNDWKDWWKNPEHVKLYQFMGKDNVPFHSILFPGTLLGTRDKYTMVHHINSTEYLNYEDGKFSKSRGIGLFGDDAMSLGIPADSFRYYLMINRPERSDTVFSWDDFQEKHNNELIGNIANLVNRTLVFLDKYYEGKIPNCTLSDKEKNVLDKIREQEHKITILLDEVKLKDALKEIMALSGIGNKFFQDSEPWRTIKEKKEDADRAMFLLAHIVKDLAILMEPYLPFSSKDIFSQLGIEPRNWSNLGILDLEPGHKLNKPKALFSKLLDEQKIEIKSKFSEKKTAPEKGFDLLNLKVAKITSVREHPKADKLLVLGLDLGSEQRQIVAGIKAYYSKEELVGKHVVVVTNLKVANLRGEDSNGMLLACSNKKGELGVLTAPNSSPGDQVFIDGIKPSEQVIGIEDFAKIGLKGKDGKAYFNSSALKTSHGTIAVEKSIEGSIR